MKRASAALLPAFILAASLGTACKSEATCESAAEHMMSLLTEQMKEMLKDEGIAKQKKQTIEKCKEERLSQSELDCLAAVKDIDAIAGCKGKK